MRSSLLSKTAMVTLVITAGSVSGTVSAEGHCNYVQENMFAGPYKVCEMPIDAATCEELGNTDDNHDAVHGDGECSAEARVGVCDKGDTKLVYYEGDAGELEIGCGFQGGDWTS